MIDTINNVVNNKSIDSYKIIEDRYLTLKRYLQLFFQNKDNMSKEDVDLILIALDDAPLEREEEKHE